MNIQYNISLKNYNTFGIDVHAKQFVSVTSETELQETLQHHNNTIFILGGGSNILFTKDVDALVIHINTKGKELVYEDDAVVHVRIAAGENWHQFVLWALENGFGGVENLSLIPGNVGAAPIQNIGAYGVELKDLFIACEAVAISTGKQRKFTHSDCNFGYRNSVFKQEARGDYIIKNVTLRLTKRNHQLHTTYGSIQEILQRNNIDQPTIKDISDAVIAIRKSKLPDPALLGNSGSFFKNPVIPTSHFGQLKEKYPGIPAYPVPENPEKHVKIPAGWLIEKCGFKGKRTGNTGVHDKQALVLVNHGNADGNEVKVLAEHIKSTVKATFGIALEAEVNIL